MLDNTLENKAKFFAQYFMQRVLKVRGGLEKDVLLYVNGSRLEVKFIQALDTCFLQLKPLSAISDEDAKSVSKIFNVGHLTGANVSLMKSILSALDGTVSNSATTEFVHHWIKAVDFLRSKGYLLPFNGLSCEELLNRGWAVCE